MMRLNEATRSSACSAITTTFAGSPGCNRPVFGKLGVSDPDSANHRRPFIDVFEEEANNIGGTASAQGTLYPDVINPCRFTAVPA